MPAYKDGSTCCVPQVSLKDRRINQNLLKFPICKKVGTLLIKSTYAQDRLFFSFLLSPDQYSTWHLKVIVKIINLQSLKTRQQTKPENLNEIFSTDVLEKPLAKC